MVSAESTATVTRDPARARAPSLVASATSLARSRSSPRPARAMPSISAMVAQVKAAWPSWAWRAARAVHLCALTWGRRRRPGRACAMVARLWSSRSRCTRRAGVVRCPVFTVGSVPKGPGPERIREGRSTVGVHDGSLDGRCLQPGGRLSRQGALPTRGARRLYRRHRRLAAQRLQPHRLRAGPPGCGDGRCLTAVRGCAVRRQGAGTGPGLAVHRCLHDLQGSHRRSRRHLGRPAPGHRCRAGGTDHGQRIRWHQLHVDRVARHHPQSLEPWPHPRRVVGRNRGRRVGRAAAHRHRERRGRIHPHPGRVLRSLRPEGHLRPHPAGPAGQHDAAHDGARLPHQVGPGHGPLLRCLQRLRSA